MILILIVYLILFNYFNRKIRKNLKDNMTTETSLALVDDELNKIKCNERTVYCYSDNNCRELCHNSVTDKVDYKCGPNNICTQSQLVAEDIKPVENCNRKFGFFDVLIADEIFEPYWTCLNTRPHLFNDKQDFHTYICAGGDRSKLDPQNIYESCICSEDKIKVHDDLRQDIPICIEKHQLSLFPNFTD